MPVLVNTHCHSKYCGHGKGDVFEYADAARAAGLDVLAFTEHYPLSSTLDPNEDLSVPMRMMDEYIESVNRAKGAHPKMDIVLGIELDYLGELEDRDIGPQDLSQFELVLGSVHFVDGFAFDDPSLRHRWEEDGMADSIWSRYLETWCEMASDASNGIDVLSHPDLPKKFGYYPSFDLDDYHRKMAEAAASGGKMIELNTSGSYYDCKEPYPSLSLLASFREAGVECTVGTDAHAPQNVARGIEEAYGTLRWAGYDHLTVPTSSGDRKRIPL